MAAVQMEVLACGDAIMLCRSCVDCGLITGCYCDHCYAEDRDPKEEWTGGQHTPVCTACDAKYAACHYCRGLSWAMPSPWKNAMDSMMTHIVKN